MAAARTLLERRWRHTSPAGRTPDLQGASHCVDRQCWHQPALASCETAQASSAFIFCRRRARRGCVRSQQHRDLQSAEPSSWEMRARSLFARQRGERLLLRNAKCMDLFCQSWDDVGSIPAVRIMLPQGDRHGDRRRRFHLAATVLSVFSAREHYCAQDDFVVVAGMPSSFGSSPIEPTPPTTRAAEALELFTFSPPTTPL